MQLLERHDDVVSDGYSSCDSTEMIDVNVVDPLLEIEEEAISAVAQMPKTTKPLKDFTKPNKVSGALKISTKPVIRVANETAFVDHVPRKLCLDIDEPEIVDTRKHSIHF